MALSWAFFARRRQHFEMHSFLKGHFKKKQTLRKNIDYHFAGNWSSSCKRGLWSFEMKLCRRHNAQRKYKSNNFLKGNQLTIKKQKKASLLK